MINKVINSALSGRTTYIHPTIKTLQAEYAELLVEKKKAYAEYAAAKKEMQEVLTAKANVDRLLSPEPEKPEKEKEQTQR